MVLVVALLASCAPASPELVVTPTTALVDDRIEVVATGLEPSSLITIRATTLDQRERTWIAEAQFKAVGDGRVDLSRVAPLPGGTYEGTDAMGLFWSAVPSVEGAQIARRPGTIYETAIELIVEGEVVDRETVRRGFDAPGSSRQDVADGPVIGAYYRPDGRGPFPGVVVFGGSDGGLQSAEWRACLLAARGFAALAVAVFGYEGRPDDLVEVPIEDARAAVSWLDDRPETARIGLLGFSRGSELALSLAARDPRVGAVVAISSTAYVWPGISDGPPEKRSAWSWGGEPVPVIPWSIGPAAGKMFGEGPPFRLRLLYEESLAGASSEVREAAAIAVTDIKGQVLLVSGDEDGSWPASDMSRTLVERMAAARRAEDITHLSYAGAGHLLFWDFLPATASQRNQGQIFGGSPAATAQARANSWPKIQAFLETALRP